MATCGNSSRPLSISIGEACEVWGLSERSMRRVIRDEGWEFVEETCRGGRRRFYPLSSLPEHRQREFWAFASREQVPRPAQGAEAGQPSPGALVCPEFSALAIASGPARGAGERGGRELAGADLDETALRRLQISQEAGAVPSGATKGEWARAVAARHGVSEATVRRYAAAPLKRHTKARHFKSWDAEAVDFWLGLNVKPEHRRLTGRALYSHLKTAAAVKGWRIGSYRSAMDIVARDLDPLKRAYQKGGARALDNALPGVLRDYSDLAPLQIVVGDQHVCDFWVIDDSTGQVFRPMLYLLQDLRTRALVGIWAARKYSGHTIGQAMRTCLLTFGLFEQFYSDNGKPEISRYIEGVMAELARLNPSPAAPPAGENLRRAIVKNAKAKMIEGTFRTLEGVMRDVALVPGYVKRMGDSPEEQDADRREAERLARSGKLLCFGEFMGRVLAAMTHYNTAKHHSGLAREWKWSPRPKTITPKLCFERCAAEGWKPTRIPDTAVDLLLMPKALRVVDRGRITFDHRKYEHSGLARLHGQRVTVRYDFFDRDALLVYRGGEFVGEARPVEYSSMLDNELASRKIREKRALGKAIRDEVKALVAGVPDVREFSNVPAAERTAALVGKERRRQKEKEALPACSEAGVALIDSYESKPIPIFESDSQRYRYLLGQVSKGEAIGDDDLMFISEFERSMTPGTARYYLDILRMRDIGGEVIGRLESIAEGA